MYMGTYAMEFCLLPLDQKNSARENNISGAAWARVCVTPIWFPRCELHLMRGAQ